MPGPAPPVVSGLQIDQSLDFQRRFRRVQTIAWSVLALLPIGAVLGLFGNGLFSEATAGGRSAGVEVSYQRFGRLSADTELQVTVRRASDPVVVSISRKFLDGYSVSEVRPEPERVKTRPDRLDFEFAALPGAEVTFALQAQRVGSSSGTVMASGSRAVRLRQFIYP